MIQTVAEAEDLSAMPEAWDFPHMIALLVVVIGVTIVTAIRSARKRGELEPAGAAADLLGFLVLIPVAFLQAAIVYLAPAAGVVALIKLWILGVELEPGTFVDVFIDPMLKLAVLICLLDNLADAMATEKRTHLGPHLVQFVVIVIPAYAGTMGLAWVLARVIAAGGGFAPEHVAAATDLFRLPSFAPGPIANLLVLAALLLVASLLAYPLRLGRTPVRRQE